MEKAGIVNKYSLVFYWIVPVTLGIIQASFNYYFEILPVGISLVDGTVFGFLLGAFGMAIWFVVRYNSPDDKPFAQLISTHLAASIILSLAWAYSSAFITRSLIAFPEYLTYQENNLPNRIFIGFIFYTLMATVFYLYIFYRKNKEKIDREVELKQEVREAVLRALKSQINPHFLFNSLNSIASLTLTNPEKAHEMVIALSDFMRYSLRKQHNEMVALEEEINHIRLYLQIEKIRFGDKMTYSFQVEPDCLDCQIPTLLLQPLFENAVKYGVYEASEQVDISLVARKEGDHTVLVLTNNFDKEAAPVKGEGIGLKNVQERLRLVYNSNNLMEIKEEEGRFVITIYLPCEKNVTLDHSSSL
ncbi:MAG: histidine kinase [Bacteroidota bacterium]